MTGLALVGLLRGKWLLWGWIPRKQISDVSRWNIGKSQEITDLRSHHVRLSSGCITPFSINNMQCKNPTSLRTSAVVGSLLLVLSL